MIIVVVEQSASMISPSVAHQSTWFSSYCVASWQNKNNHILSQTLTQARTHTQTTERGQRALQNETKNESLYINIT